MTKTEAILASGIFTRTDPEAERARAAIAAVAACIRAHAVAFDYEKLHGACLEMGDLRRATHAAVEASLEEAGTALESAGIRGEVAAALLRYDTMTATLRLCADVVP